MPLPRTTHTAPQCRTAGGVAVLEEVRRRNRASVRVAVLALQRIQQKRARRQLVQQVRPLLPRRLVLRITVCIFRRLFSCCIHSHRETRNSVCMCAESTVSVIIGRGHRGAVRHASAHTEQHPHTGKQNRGERRMTPRAGNTAPPTAGTHATASPSQHGTQANVTPSSKAFLRNTVQTFVCVCVLKRQKRDKKEGQRKAHQHSKRHSWTAVVHAVRPRPQQSRTVAAHTHPQRKQKKRKTRRQGVAVCVCGAAGVCPPWQQ
ncbi:hypothetical protein MOQ_007495 [Trypanosoma cruzi marinkellei]|uniref:Uncharacterized protein n=1 Tax=Trypanosoma cruzi marinkellei TaxID=85056 RepID=K2NIJ9_TRYCR|nr:hypothetical protein MOQ_007495 [Trypanosoma cruzi marinkellei]